MFFVIENKEIEKVKVKLTSETAKQMLKFHKTIHNVTYKEIADKLHLTVRTIKSKFKGDIIFTDAEIQILKNMLHMNTADVVRIFYPESIINAGEQHRINILKDLDDYIRIRYRKEIVISSRLDLSPLKTLFKRFLVAWINHPQQRIFNFQLSTEEKELGNRLFAIHDILIQEKKTQSIVHYRLFKRVELKPETVTLEIDDNLCEH